MRNRKFHQRRGITLLFVVSMIVLFLLMGTTFVVVSNSYLRASKKRARIDIHMIDSSAHLDRALYDLIRGPELTNSTSPLRGHDLLSDQYGYGFKAYVNNEVAPAYASNSSNQFIEFVIASRKTTDPSYDSMNDVNQAFELLEPDMPASDLSESQGIYNGLVLTFVSGPLNGRSTRIYSYTIDSGNHFFTVPAMGWKDSSGVLSLASLVDSEVVVNGREFSGTGAGGFTSAAGLEMESLEPNRRGESLDELRDNYFNTAISTSGYSSRSPNEPYDAADFQNMFLAGKDDGGGRIMSFHRDQLGDQTVPGTGPKHLPVSERNPGMFAALTNAGGPLMVDTDNDSELDATWIDIGIPVQSNGEGLYYKPLVAYQVLDLDGRLNLNAHGNLTHVDPTTNNYYIDATSPVSMLGGKMTNTLPRGSGMGPPEVSLSGIFDNTQLADLFAARYGSDGLPGTGGVVAKSQAKLFGHPFDIVDWLNDDYGTVGNLFASSPMDLHGRFAIGTPQSASVQLSLSTGKTADNFRDLNFNRFSNALPVIDMFSSNWNGAEFANSPYAMSFAPPPFYDSSDAPFGALELEKVFRSSDVDSNLLPARLWDIPGANENERQMFWTANRDLVTTDSFEIPTTYDSVRAIVRIKLAGEMGLNLADEAEAAMVDTRADLLVSQNLFAPESLRGLKLDVNRPFGNGFDDNGGTVSGGNADDDTVVDNPGEEPFERNVDQERIASVQIPMDLNNDGTRDANDVNARIEFAKQLYILMLLIADEVPVDLDGDGMDDANGFKKAMAQWAVNVVDFRDPDSIMTRFDYDLDPWDAAGWNPTGNDFVWGCERPELLITETFAGHARRTEDLGTDSTGSNNATVDGDQNFDQRLRPEAFAFIELYNPWTQNSLNQQFDSSLYNKNQGVDLARYTLASNGPRSPVWRISIDRPDRGEVLQTNSTPLRYIYFVDPDASGNDNIGDDDNASVEIFFSSFDAGTLAPGGQALIGSLGIEDPSSAGQYRSYFGRRTGKTEADELADNLELDTTRHIAIDPDNGEVTRFPADPMNDPRYATIVPVDTYRPGIPAGGPTSNRSFNVSDPFGGYTDVDVMGMPLTPVPDGQKFETPWDMPLDHQMRTDVYRDPDDMADILMNEGMAQQFRIARLQRLANPLEPWDEDLNPYITIDSMEMDLVAFNGVTTDMDPMGDAVPMGLTPPDADNASISLERGEQNSTLPDEERRQLWGSGRGAIGAGTAGTGDHNFDVELVESLGKTNDSYTVGVTEDVGFPWMTWSNRPYVSHLELANVPYVAPNQLMAVFSIDDGAMVDPYMPGTIPNRPTLSGSFGHLLNFFANDVGAMPAQPNLYKIMDYLEVPSRFLGVDATLTPTNWARNPFNYISRYRVPGKINLNTIYDEEVWNALMNDVAENNYASMDGCTWGEFEGSRKGSSGSTDFENPFRPAGTGGYVPNGVTPADGVECTLFRSDGAGEPLFDFDSDLTVDAVNAANDTNRSVYFRNAMRQRLGNLVTTRSSVFAIWITVGYFEVDETGALVDANMGGKEIGAETGEVKRNRGFYVFDRSIPVAFEPGKNHNVERGILVKSIIE